MCLGPASDDERSRARAIMHSSGVRATKSNLAIYIALGRVKNGRYRTCNNSSSMLHLASVDCELSTHSTKINELLRDSRSVTKATPITPDAEYDDVAKKQRLGACSSPLRRVAELDERLALLVPPLQTRDVPHDGNCFFSAANLILQTAACSPKTFTAEELATASFQDRVRVVAFMRANLHMLAPDGETLLEKIEHHIADTATKSVETYLNKMAESSTWADMPVLMCWQELFRVQLHLVSNLCYVPQVCPPGWSDASKWPTHTLGILSSGDHFLNGHFVFAEPRRICSSTEVAPTFSSTAAASLATNPIFNMSESSAAAPSLDSSAAALSSCSASVANSTDSLSFISSTITHALASNFSSSDLATSSPTQDKEVNSDLDGFQQLADESNVDPHEVPLMSEKKCKGLSPRLALDPLTNIRIDPALKVRSRRIREALAGFRQERKLAQAKTIERTWVGYDDSHELENVDTLNGVPRTVSKQISASLLKERDMDQRCTKQRSDLYLKPRDQRGRAKICPVATASIFYDQDDTRKQRAQAPTMSLLRSKSLISFSEYNLKESVARIEQCKATRGMPKLCSYSAFRIRNNECRIQQCCHAVCLERRRLSCST